MAFRAPLEYWLSIDLPLSLFFEISEMSESTPWEA